MIIGIHGKNNEKGLCTVDIGIGEERLQAVISTSLMHFASLSRKYFDQLVNEGVIRDIVRLERQQYHVEKAPYRLGKANIWVIGSDQSTLAHELYSSVDIAANDVETSYLGMPFVNHFDIAEFWKNGFCSLRCGIKYNIVEVRDERPDTSKDGFYGYREVD